MPLPARKEKEMRTLGRTAVMAILAVALLGVGFCPSRAFADGDEKSEAPKARPPRIEAPAAITERERLLLDRLEQLEQRVAELEAKNRINLAILVKF
jgi:hypothetical protein